MMKLRFKKSDTKIIARNMAWGDPRDWIAQLKKWDDEYFNKGGQPVSDEKYDALRKKAKAKFPNDPYFKTVGAPQVSREAVQLPIKMPGLGKFTPAEVKDWVSKNDYRSDDSIILMDKIDGVSVLLIYFDGKLMSAFSRGDDSKGRDITAHAKHISHLPKKLEWISPVPRNSSALTGAFAVRGELAVPVYEWEKLKKTDKIIVNKGKSNETRYKNPRSMVASLLLRQEPSPLLKYVVFCPFSIEENTTSLTTLEAYHEINNLFPWPVNGEIKSVDFLYNTSAVTKLVKNTRDTSDFFCDGVVAHVDGVNSGMNGQRAFAIKLPALEQAKINGVRTSVKKVVIKMSARNLAKPVIHIDPVEIDGMTISTITGNNIREINEYKIGLGSQVTVVRAGDVIPHIVKPEDKKDPDRITPSKSFKPFTQCPDCKRSLTWTYTSKGEQGADMQCTDELCRQQKMVVNFFIKLGAKDVGEENLLSVIDEIGEDCTVQYLLGAKLSVYQKALGENLGKKTRDSLRQAMNCDHAKLMYASGIFSGSTVSIGADTFRKFISRLSVTIDDLLTVDDAVMLKHVQQFHLTETEKLFARRITAFAKFYDTIYDYHNPPETNDKWKGRVYAFTGFRDDQAIDTIAKNGGSYSSSMTSKVTHLVYASASGDKYKKAKERGIVLLTPHEFEKSLTQD